MTKTIGNMNWDACQTCKHLPEEVGGCDIDVPDSIEMMVLNGDYIECGFYQLKTTMVNVKACKACSVMVEFHTIKDNDSLLLSICPLCKGELTDDDSKNYEEISDEISR